MLDLIENFAVGATADRLASLMADVARPDPSKTLTVWNTMPRYALAQMYVQFHPQK
jgi:hypothetical protein